MVICRGQNLNYVIRQANYYEIQLKIDNPNILEANLQQHHIVKLNIRLVFILTEEWHGYVVNFLCRSYLATLVCLHCI